MKACLPPEELARDERFVRNSIMARARDPRIDVHAGRASAARPRAAEPRAARRRPRRPASLMHGIFTGEIQALEGAGRTCWDFPIGNGARRGARSSSSSTWPASAGTRPATARSR